MSHKPPSPARTAHTPRSGVEACDNSPDTISLALAAMLREAARNRADRRVTLTVMERARRDPYRVTFSGRRAVRRAVSA